MPALFFLRYGAFSCLFPYFISDNSLFFGGDAEILYWYLSKKLLIFLAEREGEDCVAQEFSAEHGRYGYDGISAHQSQNDCQTQGGIEAQGEETDKNYFRSQRQDRGGEKASSKKSEIAVLYKLFHLFFL